MTTVNANREAHASAGGRAGGSADDAAALRLADLAAAVREHEQALSRRPYAIRHQDLHLYRRLRQICGGR